MEIEMKIEKQASNIIKPLVPTHPSIRHYKTGVLDELAPPMNVSIVLFFSTNREHDQKFVNKLEQSLEKTLTRFYPLAGRYVDKTCMVDCNDEGVEFIHANVNINMQDILATDDIYKFLDKFISSKTENSNPLLAIQLTMFKCGSLALGVSVAHKIVDASTICTFLNEWASMNREVNDNDLTRPCFNSSSLFPGRCLRPIPVQSISDDDMSSKYITKKVTFSETAISNIKAKLFAKGNISTHCHHVSKVQLVLAIIWKALIDVDRANNNPRESILIQAVNLRGKTASLIPKHSCGNLWGICATQAGIVETTEELVERLTDNVKKTINNFSKVNHNTEEGQSIVLSSLSVSNIKESTNVIALTSWCKFPFYEADFGFGKPTLVCPVRVPYMNTSCLMDEAQGNGVEAYIFLEVKDVPSFEKALQVHSYSA